MKWMRDLQAPVEGASLADSVEYAVTTRRAVLASFANRPVSLRVYPDRVVVAAEGLIVCEHQRIISRSHDGPGQTVYDWRHYLAVVQRKPGALRNGAPFTELPEQPSIVCIPLQHWSKVSEAIDLQVGSVILETAPVVHLHGKGRKRRSVPLWNETARTLKRWMQDHSPAAKLTMDR
jgi:hypothetical protein